MVKETKYYDLLGCSPSADAKEIKACYRKKALSLHPDKETDPKKKAEAEEKFKEVSRAYEALSDPEMRARYDRLGEKGLEEGGGGGGMDHGDIFSSLFGGGGGRKRERKPKEILHQLDVSLEDFYNGRVRKLLIVRDRFCGTCGGSGCKTKGASIKCPGCNGKGCQVGMQQLAPGFVQHVQMVCKQCKGKGTSVQEKDKCTDCKGKQVLEDKKVFEVTIDKGMKDGDHVTFAGEGDQVPDVGAAGDIIILFREQKHSVFKRKGRMLQIDHKMTMVDALCGFEFAVTHLDGRKILVKSQEGQVLKPGTVYTVHREGMPVKGTGGCERGELVINVDIEFPKTLSAKQVTDIRAILGPMRSAEVMATDDMYETSMQQCMTSLEDLAGREEEEDDDGQQGGHGGGGGGGVQCAQQ